MGAHLGARSARICSRPLWSARLGTAVTWARAHSCRPPLAEYIPGGQGVAGSNPAVPTGFSNTCYPKLGTKIAQLGMIMLAVPRTPQSRAAQLSSRDPALPQVRPGVPRSGRTGAVRQDRWHRRGGVRPQNGPRQRTPGTPNRWCHPARRQRPSLRPTRTWWLCHPRPGTGPGPIPSEQPEDVQATRINRQPPGSLTSGGPGPGQAPAPTEASSYSSDTQGDHDSSGLRSISVQSCT